jgi:hypothetical protein
MEAAKAERAHPFLIVQANSARLKFSGQDSGGFILKRPSVQRAFTGELRQPGGPN